MKCPDCEFQVIDQKSHLLTHIEIVHVKKTHVKCPHCDEHLTSNNLLNNHISKAHKLAKQATPKETNSLPAKPIMETKPLSLSGCLFCEKTFVDEKTLEVHFLTKHKGKAHKCSYCNVHAFSKENLLQHLAMVHKDIVEKANEVRTTINSFETKPQIKIKQTENTSRFLPLLPANDKKEPILTIDLDVDPPSVPKMTKKEAVKNILSDEALDIVQESISLSLKPNSISKAHSEKEIVKSTDLIDSKGRKISKAILVLAFT